MAGAQRVIVDNGWVTTSTTGDGSTSVGDDLLPSVTPDVVMQARNVSKRHGLTKALDDMSLEVRRGEIIALLGPSGSGKSTFLAAVAGLVRVDAGTISFGERIVSGPGAHVSPQERRVGLVFQDHALFPHKTVAENVGFGLQGHSRRDRRDRDDRVAEMLGMVRLADKGHRFPHELSGGESQRVALARALAPSPEVLLLDEPFASLDPTLRSEVRDEVQSLLRSLGAAAVLVSHDIEDALALGDRLAVLRAGRIVQIGTAEHLYRRPIDEHVARMFGTFTALPAVRSADRAVAAVTTALGPVAPDDVLDWADGPVVLARPGSVEIVRSGDGTAGAETWSDGAPGIVRSREFIGYAVRLVVALDDGPGVSVDVHTEAGFAVGDQVRLQNVVTHRRADR